MKLGIVGTSFIATELIKTLKSVTDIKIKASCVYSRSQEKADEYVQTWNLDRGYSDYEQFLKSDIEIVYIATPNTCHYPQAVKALNAKKHVLLEKPMALKPEEVNELFEIAQRNNVVLMEAMVTLSKEPLHQLKEFLKYEKTVMVDFHLAKQTRHYQEYRAGKSFNVLNKHFGGGATNDLGTYCLYPLNYLFGPIDEISSVQTLSPEQADETSLIIGKANDVLIQIATSKIALKPGPSLIITEDKIIKIPNVVDFDCVIIENYQGEQLKKFTSSTMRMEDEILYFQTMIKNNKLTSSLYSEEIAYHVCEQLARINKMR